MGLGEEKKEKIKRKMEEGDEKRIEKQEEAGD
jgi:hypothetical protein